LPKFQTFCKSNNKNLRFKLLLAKVVYVLVVTVVAA
jgi:hypothetical protein